MPDCSCVKRLRQLGDRADDVERVQQERHQAGDREQVLRHPPRAEPEDHDDRELDAAPGDGPRDGGRPHRPHGVVLGVARVGEDPLALPLLGAARLDGPDRAQRPLERAAEPADGLLGGLLRLRDAGQQQRHEHADDDDRADGRGQQHEVEDGHEDQRPDERDDAVDQADQAGRRGLAQQQRVRRGARDQLADGPARHRGHGRAQELPHQRLARVQHDALGHGAHEDPLREPDRRPDDQERRAAARSASPGSGPPRGSRAPTWSPSGVARPIAVATRLRARPSRSVLRCGRAKPMRMRRRSPRGGWSVSVGVSVAVAVIHPVEHLCSI